ncbi:amino acid ABC transporter ATP-binding protein [Geobacter sulfurreducens]|uniref:Amino acid ABC transporter, ATP-binding protein n=1 Tax=Geobacter sulfurreducens (strain ATCC 51573 / DSM 12127 / PCA) TaxID=243231 RepID=Q74F11_GEOSL|nr:amino acid ABC transporter ATP-binding protein [Geobacter sulfurreducens]AAR34128.1 amino acid ABC transporter, ATP-binding protein [Geobacter sulfurreducens PCA]ADI83641.1 amino acid ABC transporter, ATP-binding protein [Geobacter sulfurreducens KN400]AJY70541.1 arginine ABC transporter ATP-binding protein [Geobacter sulfurreducens]BBA69341.1 Glutamine transport ATP-binding protein GlnQ [Geobacter sulfurreducens]HBB69557.1 amino acid ABC transporter ATP-binding protein [Geobacter sulfurred
MSDVKPLIQLENITKRFKSLTAVNGVNLAVHPGEKLVIIGPSGSGKSTLLRSINFLEEIDEGTIRFEGNEVGYVRRHGKLHLDKQPVICALRAEIGMVFQHFHLFPHMTVLGNVMEGPLTVQKKSAAESREIALAMLAKVGLTDKKDVYPATLSGGQKQRVAIARAIAMRPKLMLFDEPTSALDPELVGEVFDTIHALADEGMTMIIVTHHMGFARELADRVIFMEKGNFLAEGTPQEFFAEGMNNERIQSFLNRIL